MFLEVMCSGAIDGIVLQFCRACGRGILMSLTRGRQLGANLKRLGFAS